MRQKPKKIQEQVFDSTRDDPKNPLDPQVMEELNWDWDYWKKSAHSQGTIATPNDFWTFYNELAEANEDVLYPNGIEMSFTDEGKTILSSFVSLPHKFSSFFQKTTHYGI